MALYTPSYVAVTITSRERKTVYATLSSSEYKLRRLWTRIPSVDDTLRVVTEGFVLPGRELRLDAVPQLIQQLIHPLPLIALTAVPGAVPSPVIVEPGVHVVWSAALGFWKVDLTHC